MSERVMRTIAECADVSVVAIDENIVLVYNGDEIVAQHTRDHREHTLVVRVPESDVNVRIQLYPHCARTMCDVELRQPNYAASKKKPRWPYEDDRTTSVYGSVSSAR